MLRRSGATTASVASSDRRSEPGTWRTTLPFLASMITVRLLGPSPIWPTKVAGATAAGGPEAARIGGTGPRRPAPPPEASHTPPATASRPTRTSAALPWSLRRPRRRTAPMAGSGAAWPATARAWRRERVLVTHWCSPRLVLHAVLQVVPERRPAPASRLFTVPAGTPSSAATRSTGSSAT